MKNIIIVLIVAFLLFGCLGPLFPEQKQANTTTKTTEKPTTVTETPDEPQEEIPGIIAKPKGLTLYFMDIATVDDNSQAIVIQTKNKNILVDTGSFESYTAFDRFISKKDIDRFDLVITTSSNQEYSGALKTVLANYIIGEVWRPKAKSYQSPTYEQLLKTQSSTGTVVSMMPGLTKTYDGVKLTVISQTDPDQNNFAPVIRVDYGETCVLLTSRINTGGQRYLLNYAKENLPCDIMQVPDSGLSESNTQLKLFLDEVNPQAVVISGGVYDKKYTIKTDSGRSGTINIINLKSIPTYMTYEKTVVVSSDGKDYTIEYEK